MHLTIADRVRLLLWGPPWRPLTESAVERTNSGEKNILTTNLPAIVIVNLNASEHIGGGLFDVSVLCAPVDARFWNDFVVFESGVN